MEVEDDDWEELAAGSAGPVGEDDDLVRISVRDPEGLEFFLVDEYQEALVLGTISQTAACVQQRAKKVGLKVSIKVASQVVGECVTTCLSQVASISGAQWATQIARSAAASAVAKKECARRVLLHIPFIGDTFANTFFRNVGTQELDRLANMSVVNSVRAFSINGNVLSVSSAFLVKQGHTTVLLLKGSMSSRGLRRKVALDTVEVAASFGGALMGGVVGSVLLPGLGTGLLTVAGSCAAGYVAETVGTKVWKDEDKDEDQTGKMGEILDDDDLCPECHRRLSPNSTPQADFRDATRVQTLNISSSIHPTGVLSTTPSSPSSPAVASTCATQLASPASPLSSSSASWRSSQVAAVEDWFGKCRHCTAGGRLSPSSGSSQMTTAPLAVPDGLSTELSSSFDAASWVVVDNPDSDVVVEVRIENVALANAGTANSILITDLVPIGSESPELDSFSPDSQTSGT